MVVLISTILNTNGKLYKLYYTPLDSFQLGDYFVGIKSPLIVPTGVILRPLLKSHT